MSSHCFFFFFNDTATTEIYTLSLHDALPISRRPRQLGRDHGAATGRGCHARKLGRDVRSQPPGVLLRGAGGDPPSARVDRKSTRLNSSHGYISYAVFCLKKKKTTTSRLRSSC